MEKIKIQQKICYVALDSAEHFFLSSKQQQIAIKKETYPF
jgi:hypothetical protein